jgi:hypothetical protein
MLAILMLLPFLACTKKSVPISEPDGLGYYPVTKGKYVVYDIDSTVYTEIPRDTIYTRYRIKEKIADSFTDNLGQPAIRLERYIRMYDPAKPYDSIPWRMKEVWMINADNNRIQVVEGNVRYTKLIFPIIEKNSWNGNAANTIGAWTYYYDYIDRPEKINGVDLEKVLLVVQKNDISAISAKRYNEKYAEGIGLVQREITEVFSNAVIPNMPVEARIEKGISYKQILVTHGFE